MHADRARARGSDQPGDSWGGEQLGAAFVWVAQSLPPAPRMHLPPSGRQRQVAAQVGADVGPDPSIVAVPRQVPVPVVPVGLDDEPIGGHGRIDRPVQDWELMLVLPEGAQVRELLEQVM